MIARGLKVVGAALPLLLLGCVVEQRDFEALRDQVRLQQKQINDLKSRQDEQGLRVDTLNNGFKILGDKAEENARRIDGLEEGTAGSGTVGAAAAPRETFASAAPLEPPPPPVVIQQPPPPPPPLPPPPPPPQPVEPILLTNLPKAAPAEAPAEGELITAGPKAEKLYAGALALFSNREYAQATAKFREFTGTYPEHKLAGNAQYWIGECYYSQKRFAEAAEEFSQVERLYPASPKVPAALLKRGLSLWELKKVPEALASLQRILDKHPNAEEATKAHERLDRWKQQ